MDLRDSRVKEIIPENERSKWIAHSNHNIICFTEDDIIRITNNYRTMLGRGGFGDVYEGVLEDKSMVAVKKFVRNVKEDFAKELKVHSEVNHKNVVRLIGYCAEKDALMLVTEYIPKGNLNDVLHHHGTTITLDARLRISVECAEALSYMHSHMYTKVIHGDIKPANILLDDHLNAKLSDFGISRLVNTDVTPFTKHVIGSIGYMDPLFARYGRLTSKSDVYSFGILLLELITKKKVTIATGKISIVENFTQALATGIKRVRELFDAEISSQNNMKVLEGVAKLAGECLSMEMDRRPEMKDVAERLRVLRKAQHQGKQRLALFSLFSWGLSNKPSAQNNFSGRLAEKCDVYSFGVSVPAPEAQCPAPLSFPDPIPEEPLHSASTSTTTDSVEEPIVAAPEESPKAGFIISPNGKFKQNIKSWMRGALLGSGSFGTVYEGISDEGAFFAVKEVSLLDQGSNAQQSILALEQEIALLSQFEHENVVQYYGTDKEESKLHIFIELVTQGSLLSLYQKYKLRDLQVSAYTRQILNGLVYLHERNVIHRDIKCANILVHANGSVKLADFGLAKEISKINMPRSCTGSVYWMAPEVVNPRKTYGPAADMWSLGCTVLEMLTCQIPYPNVEWADAFFMIGRGEQPPIPSYLSKEAQDFISQCVRVNPETRPSASQLLAHPFCNISNFLV